MLFLLLPLLSCIVECRPLSNTVDTPRGRIEGFKVSYSPNHPISPHSSSGNVFLGIPYVYPPTGERRFKRPEPLLYYGNVALPANKMKPACQQARTPEQGPLEMSEDCLYLNVMTPSNSSDRLYPVMVYIHGGSLAFRSARDMAHEGVIRNLVRHGVIVVTIQYRLGALGFFNTGTEDFPSNLGMLDQVEALRWVQSEIVFFGGDPTRVTLYGHSAGAASISAHTYSPLSRGLFHSVILMSGSILTCLDGALGSTDLSRLFAEKICSFNSSDWETGNFSRLHTCLDTMDPKKIADFDESNMFGWKMVQDPFFLPSTPHKLAPFRQNMPVLIGSVRDEFKYFLDLIMLQVKAMGGIPSGLDPLVMVLSQLITDKTQLQAVMPLVMGAYANKDSNDQLAAMKSITDAVSPAAFIAPMQKDIREWMENGNFHIFIYEMTHPSHVMGDNYAAIHGGEIPYISADSKAWQNATAQNWTTPFDFQLIEWMGNAWTNFAISGIPDPSWSPVSPFVTRLPYLEIASTGRRMNEDYRSRDEQLWNVEVPKTIGDLPKEKLFLFTPSN